MLTAILRATRANIRQRRWASLLAAAIVMAAAATITLALDVRRGASAPFDRVFASTRGAHVEASGPLADAGRMAALARRPRVVALAGPVRFAIVPTTLHGVPDDLFVETAVSPDRPVERPLLRDGRFASA